MTTAKILLTAALMAAGGVAQAQWSSTITAASDYEFRGVSLSQSDPVLQASLDFAFANGFAVGAWATNLDYGDAYDGDFELDLYASYTGQISDSNAWSAGLTAYTYPDSKARAATPTQDARLKIEPYIEGYVDLTLGSWQAAQWYTHDYSGLGIAAQYTEVNYTHALPHGLSLGAHAGYSWGDYWEDDTQGGGELFDYSLGLSFEAAHFTLAAKLVATDASEDRKVTQGAFKNDARVVISIATTLPRGQ